MHIAIDVSPMESGHALRGVGVYVNELVEALRKYEASHTYTLFTHKQNVPNTVDLVHYPYFDPFFLTLPLIKTTPTVVTVHDLIPLVFPDKFPAGIKGGIKWFMQKYSLLGAKRIITDSEASKNDIHRIIGFDIDKIDRVYLAPRKQFYQANKKPKPYILYVGDVNWNKNVPSLIKACATFKDLSLVLVGGSFINNSLAETRSINSLINELGMEKQVTRKGYVSDDALAILYQEATMLVQPSYYEGFGLPILEAMACGCPVLTAKNSSLAEISGPAVEMGTEYDSIVTGIRSMLKINRELQIKKQYTWVKRFSWEHVARETVVSYEKAINYYSSI